MVTPGCPHLAVRYAYEDAIVDHAGGEGVYGEMFFAAIESAIFFEKDRDRLLSIGLGYIPENCRTARAVRDIIAWHRQGIEWTTAREMIIKHHGNDNFTDAPQNVAFTILGWLYGDDFEDAILKAVNCGYDTDCTAATLGAILGMIMGLTNLPLKWTDPLGDGIVVSKPVKGFDIPRNLHELTARTIRMGRKVLAAWEADIFIHCELPTNLDGAPGGADQEIRDMWTRDVNGNRWLLPENSAEAFGLELKLSYGAGGPVIGVSHQKQLSFTLTNHSLESWEGRLSLDVPERWECEEPISAALEPGETFHFAFRITSSGELMPSYECSLRISRWHDVQQWAEIKVPFTLIAASHWLLEGPESLQGEAAVSGNRIDWHSTLGTDQTGLYRAVTRMIVPEARNVRLIVAANCRATVNLNGEQLLSFDEGADFMPAFHRAPSEQYAELSMESGSYELEVIAAKTANPLQVYVLPVSTGQTKQPGPYYYFTDILFGPPL
jgi:hypothetical protein